MEKNQAIAGLYLSRRKALKAKESLIQFGFPIRDVAVLSPNKTQQGHRDFVYNQRTNIISGAVLGGTIGLFLLGTLAFLTSLNNPVASVVDLNQASMMNFNPSWILTTAIGLFLGLILGSACGALVGIGTPKSVGKRFGFYLTEGGYVLSVHIDNKEQEQLAMRTLESTGAQDISYMKESEVWETVIPEKRKLIQGNFDRTTFA